VTGRDRTDATAPRRPAMTDTTFLALVIALAIALRLPLLALDVAQTSDFEWYFDAATAIAQGQGYLDKGVPTAFWPPGWPGFLAACLALFGQSARTGQCANLLLAAASIALIRPLGLRLFPGSRAWRLAALAIALLPNQIAYVPLLSAEVFFQFLLLAACLLVLSGPALAAGAAFGLAALTKTQALLLPLLLAPVLPAPRLRKALIAAAAMLAAVLPWTLRNHAVLGAFVPVSTNGGYTLLTGNNPTATGRYSPGDPLVTAISKDPRDQVQADRLARAAALDWIAADPAAFLRLLPRKFAGLWFGDGEAEWFYQLGYPGYADHALAFRAVRIANQACYLALMALALAALPAMVRHRRTLPSAAWTGWLLAAYFTAISLVFSGQSRFHFALMPFMALYAAWTVTRLAGDSE